MSKPRKISIVGPESTGKSALAHFLAKKTDGCLVAEVARKYIDQLNRSYFEDDLLKIAKLQKEEEEKCGASIGNSYIICDTNLLVIKIWSLHKYHRCHPWIEEALKNNKDDLYLLTNIDLPWEEDPQREHPLLREFLFNWYHKELIEQHADYEIVTGQGDNRFYNALKLISL